jgi:4-hydroxybenzoate polyprenyltransferase
MPIQESSKQVPPADSLALCVDLDGTLLRSDSLLETMLVLIKERPFCIVLLPFWLLKGKAHFKRQIAQRVTLDVTCLPYHPELLSYLRDEHRLGRNIVLATGADIAIARRIADHLGFFSMVLATDGVSNLTGLNKLQSLKNYLGNTEFVYAGNSKVDIPIWVASNNAILVNAPKRLKPRIAGVTGTIRVFEEPRPSVWTIARAIRVHQWAKNLLIFIPVIAGHQFSKISSMTEAIIAFIAFSLCSSAAYVTNDLLDLDADRHHPTKKHRAFAAGKLSLKTGMIALPILCLTGFLLGWFLSPRFAAILGLYFASTLAYSFVLKRLLLIDVFVLASLYTLRIMAGAAATHIAISYWLLLFSLFLFLSLAFLKRFSELQRQHRDGKQVSKSRGYLLADIEQLASMGSASGYITALILALYINSEDVRILYKRPEFLWFICPLILYWISRSWLIARRGEMSDDPVIFAIKDPSTYAIGLVAAVIFLFAIG